MSAKSAVTERLLLTGVTRLERQATIVLVTDALRSSGGWIDDVHFFSNISVNLRCAVPPAGVARLSEELGKLPLGLSRAEVALLEGAALQVADGEDLNFSLQMTFVHNEPDLRRYVPSVPG